MIRYDIDIDTAPGALATRSHIHVSTLVALDVLTWLRYNLPPATMVVRDAAGAIVPTTLVVQTALTEATTPEAREAWVTNIGEALLDQIATPHRRQRNTAISEADWERTGRWWARTVGHSLDHDVAAYLFRRGVPPDPKERHYGIRILDHASANPHRSNCSGGRTSPAPGGRWLSTSTTIPARWGATTED